MIVYAIRRIILNLLRTIETKDATIRDKDARISELLAENAKLKSQQKITQIIPKQNAILVTLSM